MNNIISTIQKFSEIILTSKKEDALDVLLKYTDGNTFAHFSDLEERFGFNPKYQWNTPFGIYGYIITEDLIEEVMNNEEELFATNRKYIHIFKAKSGSNLLNITDISKEEYVKTLTKIRKLFPNNDDKIQKAKKEANKDTFSSKLWNITKLLANENAKQWTKLLQKLGYDGVID